MEMGNRGMALNRGNVADKSYLCPEGSGFLGTLGKAMVCVTSEVAFVLNFYKNNKC